VSSTSPKDKSNVALMMGNRLGNHYADRKSLRLTFLLFVTIASVAFTLFSSASTSSLDEDFSDTTRYASAVTMKVRTDLCPDARRLGSGSAEGGWLVCNNNNQQQQQPSRECVVYSFGIKDDFSFDEAIHNSGGGCEIHGFDPSPYGLKSKPKYEAIGPRAHYHSMGLGVPDGTVQPGKAPFRWPGIGYLRESNTAPWTLKRIPTIMRELGHSRVSYLKVDTEGAEWDAIPDIVNNSEWDEFAVELHVPPKEYVIKYSDTGKDRKDGTMSAKTATVARRKDRPFEETASDPKWLDRIPLIRQLLQVADVWKIEPNPTDKNCMNAYFVKKQQKQSSGAATR